MDFKTAEFPDIEEGDIAGCDTETTGLGPNDRAVSMSVAFNHRPTLWWAWGHASGNNCTLEEFRDWCMRNLVGTRVLKIWHNYLFDLRMLANAGVNLGMEGHADTGILAPLIDERLPSFGLDALSEYYLGERKLEDTELNEWCAKQFGGKANYKAQVKNYHRAPGYMVGPYGIKDAELTVRLYHRLLCEIDRPDDQKHTLARVYDVETKLIPQIVNMNQVGSRINRGKAEALDIQLEEMLEDMKKTWVQRTKGVNYNSPPQMAAYFASLGFKIPKTKIEEKPDGTTKGGNPSCTKAVLKGFSSPDAELALKIRKVEKFKKTFVVNYLLNNLSEDNRIFPQFHQLKKESQSGSSTGTVSGRFSCSGGFNFQNLPSPDPDSEDVLKHQLSEAVRGCFVPFYPEGYILSVDYSQIEFRIIAHYAGGKLCEEYRKNPYVDFHDMVAALTGIHRKPAKNINFGLAYGMGIMLMADRLGVSYDTAKVMLEEYHSRLPEVKQIYDKAMRRASIRGYVRLLLDRKRRFMIDPYRRYGKYAHTHKALNSLAQGGGADIMKQAMVDCWDLVDNKRVFLHATIHDEMLWTIPPGMEGVLVAREIQNRMEYVGVKLGLKVPIIAECKVGFNWGEAVKWKPKETDTFPDSLTGLVAERAAADQPELDVSMLEF